MNDRVERGTVPLKELRFRTTPKGRRAEPEALADVRRLLDVAPRRRDLLIEHLHRVQDRYGHLADRHLVALAQEMDMALAEVYEVATFYHHFDVVQDGADAPPQSPCASATRLRASWPARAICCKGFRRSSARACASFRHPASGDARRRRPWWWGAIPCCARQRMP